MCHQQRAGRGEPGMSEMAVYTFRIFDRDDKLALGLASDDVHNDDFRGIAVLHVEHLIGADWLRSMDLRARRSVIVPELLFITVDQGYAELVREKHVSVREQDGIADFALSRGIVKFPGDLAATHDVHVLRLGLSGVEEIMLRQTLPGQDAREIGLGFLREGGPHRAACQYEDSEVFHVDELHSTVAV